MPRVVEVERTIPDPFQQSPSGGYFLKTIRKLVKEVRAEDPGLRDCELYDILFRKQGENIYMRLYFKTQTAKLQQ
ncbi:MAG: hypothetical protein ACOX18_01950 [Bacillota bacterium]|jgi:hypothetical protein